MSRDRRHLRLIKTERSAGGGITVAPYPNPPFAVQCLVLEEDTWFALSSPARVFASPEHPIRVMTDAWEAQPAEPGSVHVRGRYPFRLLAVVHDLSLDPSWRRDWIETAISRSLEVARELGFTAIGVEPLGAVHGRFPIADFDDLLENAVKRHAPPTLDVWRIDPRRSTFL